MLLNMTNHIEDASLCTSDCRVSVKRRVFTPVPKANLPAHIPGRNSPRNSSDYVCNWKCGPEARAYLNHALAEERATGGRISEPDLALQMSSDGSQEDFFVRLSSQMSSDGSQEDFFVRAVQNSLDQNRLRPGRRQISETSSSSDSPKRRQISETSSLSDSHTDNYYPLTSAVPRITFNQRRESYMCRVNSLAFKYHNKSAILIQRALWRYLDLKKRRKMTFIIVMRGLPGMDTVSQAGIFSIVMTYLRGRRGKLLSGEGDN